MKGFIVMKALKKIAYKTMKEYRFCNNWKIKFKLIHIIKIIYRSEV